ncbi:hypothetical protein HQQ80_06860 [Microbacteriaceae bacterium VKM Ac-2855]|nr:hypothetical protein [Microbacteriaceae bacterium VKM Ac-2855]
MTQQTPFGGRSRQLFPTMPRGEVLATYESYEEAQRAVDVLVRGDFPATKLAILGNDLKSVEKVTGKLTWGRVALSGAISGAWFGVFIGLVLIIFSPATQISFLFAAVLLGAGFWMLVGLAGHAVNRRRRDFTSTMQVIASSYSVLVDPESINRARNVLSGSAAAVEHPSWSAPTTDPVAEPVRGDEPPRDAG